MCRPALPNLFSSRLASAPVADRPQNRPQRLRRQRPRRALRARACTSSAACSTHAHAAAAFTTPTVNGYKRYRAYTLAPDRAIWARDNRGVMVRVLGQPGDPSTHLENRIGEPAANPYLYMASQIYAGLDGMAQKRDPGPSADTPYETKAQPLPKDLRRGARRAARQRSVPQSLRRQLSSIITPTSRKPSSRASKPKRPMAATADSDRLGAERIFRFVLSVQVTHPRSPSARAPR